MVLFAGVGTTVTQLKVRVFARPEDVSAEKAYKSSPWALYATSTEVNAVSVSKLNGRCHVSLTDGIKAGALRFESVHDLFPGRKLALHLIVR